MSEITDGVPVGAPQVDIGASFGDFDVFTRTAEPQNGVATPQPQPQHQPQQPQAQHDPTSDELASMFGVGIPNHQPTIVEPVNPQLTSPPAPPVNPQAPKPQPQAPDAPQSPLERLMASNPDIAAAVFKSVAETIGGPKKEEPQPLTPPQKPRPPASYSHEEALSDPSSESYRYRMQMEDYRDQQIEFLQLQQQREREQLMSTINELKGGLEHDKQRQAVIADAMSRGASQKEAVEYAKYLESMQVTDDVLWKLYQIERGQGAPQGALSQPQQIPTFQANQNGVPAPLPANPIQARAQQVQYPTPATGGTQVTAPMTSEDIIWNDIVRQASGMNPFSKAGTL